MTRYVENGYFGGQTESLLLPALYGKEDTPDPHSYSIADVVRCYSAANGKTETEFYERLASYLRARVIQDKPGRSFFSDGELVLELELPSVANELAQDSFEIEKELELLVQDVNEGAKALGLQNKLYNVVGVLLAALRTLGQMLEAAWWGDRLPVTTQSRYLNIWMNEAMDALQKLGGPNMKAFEHVRRMRLYDELAGYTDSFNDEQHVIMAEIEDTPLDQEIDFDAFLDRIGAASDNPEETGWLR